MSTLKMRRCDECGQVVKEWVEYPFGVFCVPCNVQEFGETVLEETPLESEIVRYLPREED